jgi:succinate-semialdehyde dehydrogenase/glutarate-semialdehyde dehydrogenase
MLLSINPATGETIGTVPEQQPAEVDATLTAAVRAQREWRRRDVGDRVELLRRMATVLRDDRERYARTISEEMGKPIGQARAEVDKSALTLDYYADHAPDFLAFDSIATEAQESGAMFDPLGVVLAIMPWNYPFWQFFRFAAPALAAGNGAVLKHANNVPLCAQLLTEIFEKADGPRGLFGVLFIDAGRVADVIADDRIAAVTLTGSTEVGAIVAAQAGAALKKQVLELGGSDPFIVLADADLDRASTVAVAARFTANGQSCVNAKRFLVEDSIADEFVRLFVEKARALVLGDPLDEQTTIGPMARENLRATLHDQVQRSVAAGAELRLGGLPIDGPGFYYPPTILDRVASDAAVFREETFGPVASVTRVADIAEAIALANDSEFGLGAAVWTRSADTARAMIAGLDAGAVFVNAQVASDPRLPFGGIKKSGYGRELGLYGIREFVNVKTVWIESVK